MSAFDHLVHVVARLRGDGGCDWDRAQTPESMRAYLLEEVHEVVEAIDDGDVDGLRGELGDLTFLILLVTRMMAERGAFDLDDVLGDIADKMVRRHPHVFGDAELPADWEALKAEERGTARSSLLDGLPKGLPALMRAHEVSKRAGRAGFDWPDAAGVRDKVDEELAELDQALATGPAAEVTEELGDLLFTLVNLGRFLPTSAEDALRMASRKFERRFRRLEALCLAEGGAVSTFDHDTLQHLWSRAKEQG